MKQINDTTFVSGNLGDLKPLVTIGGKAKDKFIPNLNMSFHNDEFFINLNRRDKQAISTTDKAEIDGIDKDIFYIDENGRFKWDIEFKERPSKNSWTWELKHADGIEFYYQGELTDEEIKDGCERPLEVVGSYAVYCNKANNKYKTGKICHIYRPFCYDINAESTYADLKIADGQLTITIDEIWLDNAVYPVRLDPTIGYTTAGASAYSLNGGTQYAGGTWGTAVSSGTLESFHCAANVYDSLGIKMCIVPSVSGNPTGQDVLEQVADTGHGSSDNYTISASGATIVAETEYAILIQGESNFSVKYDSGGNTIIGFYKVYSVQFPSTIDTYYVKSNGNRYSVWVTYTESGGSSLPAIINNYRQQGVM